MSNVPGAVVRISGEWPGIGIRDSARSLQELLPSFIVLSQGLTMQSLLAWKTLYRAGWPGTHKDPAASASRLLGLEMCTTPGPLLYFCYLVNDILNDGTRLQVNSSNVEETQQDKITLCSQTSKLLRGGKKGNT